MLPEILTANTYFWRPAASASGRRSNERRHSQEVLNWLNQHKDELDQAGITVDFTYSESCHHVYKSLTIYQYGRRVNINALKKLTGEYTPPAKPFSIAYKAVAVQQDDNEKIRYLSIYDGKTEYVLDQELVQPAGKNHTGGYYVYQYLDAARNADVPKSAVLYNAPRAIIEVQIAGKRVVYDNGKRAVSRLTPIRIIDY
jgi:hypothetical protein